MIKPSEVRFHNDYMLIGLFDKAEAEFAATLLVQFCQHRGDTWHDPIKIDELSHWITEQANLHADDERCNHWTTNPFFRPQPNLLIKLGMTERLENNDLRLLPAFFEKLEAHQEKHWPRDGL
jgi:hypothetical protein